MNITTRFHICIHLVHTRVHFNLFLRSSHHHLRLTALLLIVTYLCLHLLFIFTSILSFSFLFFCSCPFYKVMPRFLWSFYNHNYHQIIQSHTISVLLWNLISEWEKKILYTRSSLRLEHSISSWVDKYLL